MPMPQPGLTRNEPWRTMTSAPRASRALSPKRHPRPSRRASRRCARRSPTPDSTASSSPAPTPIAASRCPTAKRASPTSPASPARPASRWSAPRRPACSSIRRYTLQAPLETDTKLVTVIETAQGGIDAAHRRLRAQGRQARLRSVAAHAGRDQGPEREARRQGRRWCPRANLVDQHLDRPPGPAGDAGRVPRPQPRRPHRRRQARRAAQDPRRRRRRRRRADPARVDQLAVQHARPRRAQRAGRARLRAGAARPASRRCSSTSSRSRPS